MIRTAAIVIIFTHNGLLVWLLSIEHVWLLAAYSGFWLAVLVVVFALDFAASRKPSQPRRRRAEQKQETTP